MQTPKQLEQASRPNLSKPLRDLIHAKEEITVTDSVLPVPLIIEVHLMSSSP